MPTITPSVNVVTYNTKTPSVSRGSYIRSETKPSTFYEEDSIIIPHGEMLFVDTLSEKEIYAHKQRIDRAKSGETNNDVARRVSELFKYRDWFHGGLFETNNDVARSVSELFKYRDWFHGGLFETNNDAAHRVSELFKYRDWFYGGLFETNNDVAHRVSELFKNRDWFYGGLFVAIFKSFSTLIILDIFMYYTRLQLQSN